MASLGQSLIGFRLPGLTTLHVYLAWVQWAYLTSSHLRVLITGTLTTGQEMGGMPTGMCVCLIGQVILCKGGAADEFLSAVIARWVGVLIKSRDLTLMLLVANLASTIM